MLALGETEAREWWHRPIVEGTGGKRVSVIARLVDVAIEADERGSGEWADDLFETIEEMLDVRRAKAELATRAAIADSFARSLEQVYRAKSLGTLGDARAAAAIRSACIEHFVIARDRQVLAALNLPVGRAGQPWTIKGLKSPVAASVEVAAHCIGVSTGTIYNVRRRNTPLVRKRVYQPSVRIKQRTRFLLSLLGYPKPKIDS